ncbi:ion channel [Kordiimonas sp. SCSIO 12610]|uniref:ion channel n=1 Tax=Kordiimonas sp. SCSIO 12610 TaxID=2829597 RepID=UPI00210EB937|nr:ion channel [Kordiimonas sp. SCSIO 12610]UTW56514.1 two pore domain potassium channel family protein [Kordiimonas sp. SCSIO 12610]
MVAQLMIGTVLIAFTVMLQAFFFYIAEVVADKFAPWLYHKKRHAKAALSLTIVTLWVMAAHSISVWIWAFAFLQIGVFTALEPALYFSVVSLTTLGFGDVLLPTEWRLLAGLCAANGLLIFGLSTAFLVEFLRNFSQARTRNTE